MADRFVDGEPEVGRVEDEVIVTGHDRFCLHFLARLVGSLGRFTGEIVTEDIVVAAAARRRQSRARGEFTRRLVDHGHFRIGHRTHARLRDPAAGAGGETFVLAHKGEGNGRIIRAGFEGRLVDRKHSRDLLIDGHIERVRLHRISHWSLWTGKSSSTNFLN